MAPKPRQLQLVGPKGKDGPGLQPSGKTTSGEVLAEIGQIVLVSPSEGGITVKAPLFPDVGEQFGVKNISSSSATFAVTGNGKLIENPGTSFQMASGSFNVSGDGISIIWEYCGGWYVI